MFPVFSVLFPVCSQLEYSKQWMFPVFYAPCPSQEMKMEKISRNLWTYWEHEEHWEGARLSGSYGVPSRHKQLGTWERVLDRSGPKTDTKGTLPQGIHLPGPLRSSADTLEAGNYMADEFIERRETGLYIAGSRVPIDRIIWEYRNGEDPEAIRAHYPTLSVEQVNEAIAFYHHHKEEVEKAMEDRRLAEDAYTAANANPPDIKQKFERMRQQTAPRRV
jgi:uncharacterized protein (DUF433 family)